MARILAGTHLNRSVAILTCLFVWQVNAYLRFAFKVEDDPLNTIASEPIVSRPNDTNRFTSSLVASLLGLNELPSNSRGPIHDTPPLPCRCRKCFQLNGCKDDFFRYNFAVTLNSHGACRVLIFFR